MADLDILRPEVREAIHDIAIAARLRPEYQQSVGIIRAELLRLARNDADARIALDADHDWKEMYERAKKAEAELAALKARIAQAPLEVVESLPGAVGPPWPRDHWIEVRMADPCACVGPGLIGKRVRLLVEE